MKELIEGLFVWGPFSSLFEIHTRKKQLLGAFYDMGAECVTVNPGSYYKTVQYLIIDAVVSVVHAL